MPEGSEFFPVHTNENLNALRAMEAMYATAHENPEDACHRVLALGEQKEELASIARLEALAIALRNPTKVNPQLRQALTEWFEQLWLNLPKHPTMPKRMEVQICNVFAGLIINASTASEAEALSTIGAHLFDSRHYNDTFAMLTEPVLNYRRGQEVIGFDPGGELRMIEHDPSYKGIHFESPGGHH